MPILRSLLIALSRNSSLRHFAESSSLGGRMSSRFVAGISVEEVLNAAASVNRQGISTSLDSLGENVHSPQEAQQANWLPAPKGPFWAVMRLYWPKPEALDGTWKAPLLQRVN